MQDKIIRMAREAGFELGTAWYGNSKTLERFAALVAAHERENQAEQEPVGYVSQSVIDWLSRNERTDGAYSSINLYKNPCGSSDAPLYAAPVSIEAAVLDEREACAKVCEENAKEWSDGNNDWCSGQVTGSNECAAAIRARGDKCL